MPDREKVIDFLESEIYRAEQSVNDIWLECVEVKLLRDALALLKEYKRKDECPCIHCMEWECDEVCEEYKKWKDT